MVVKQLSTGGGVRDDDGARVEGNVWDDGGAGQTARVVKW
ncbi:hypothetical protein A2U01_0031235, partial [Trifolium medium]|nr:hypothetical protein [Trifolium medium]